MIEFIRPLQLRLLKTVRLTGRQTVINSKAILATYSIILFHIKLYKLFSFMNIFVTGASQH